MKFNTLSNFISGYNSQIRFSGLERKPVLTMLILRLTTKVFKKFKQKPVFIEVDKAENDLGEWYINTADSFNSGNLFMPVMHADSLYTMLLPVEKDMSMNDFVHTVYANMMIRMLRIEVPRENTERIMKLYGDQVAFSKTNSKSLLGNLNNILQDIDAIVHYRDDVAKGNNLNMARLEYRVNDTPRNLNGKNVWPLKAFYGCIRKLCPELPHRIPLPLDFVTKRDSEKTVEIFKDRVPEKLLLKISGSACGAEVLFNQLEVQMMLKVVNGSDAFKDLSSELKRILNFKLEEFENRIET